MRRLFFFLLFVAALVGGSQIIQAGRYRDVFRSICELTDEHFYKADERLLDWVRRCRSKAEQLSARATSEQVLAQVQDHMNVLNVSHFAIYSPSEDRKLWKGESVDTGVRARYVEDRLVVYRVFADSAAAKAGVKVGDEILALPGIEQVTPWGAEHRAGVFQLRRKGKHLALEVRPSPLIIDSSPTLERLGPGVGLLTISSFRAEFFRPAEWRGLVSRFGDYRHLIIDVRENAGGNFVAMLRALSTFTCGERAIGRLLQPRKAGPEKEGFDDNEIDAHQLDELEKFRALGLKTFPDYGCFRGLVTVLISSDTASVAEIFADAFKVRPRSRVWGQPSAGDVVLAVWYDLPALGPGYSFSIPEAVYLNHAHHELEGEGVFPQKELFYDLARSLDGKDSWIAEALGD